VTDRKPKMAPEGAGRCPSCGTWFKNAELMAVHLSSDAGCRREQVEEDAIQRASKHDPMRRLVLTKSLFVKVTDDREATMFAAPVRPRFPGELVMVEAWWATEVPVSTVLERRKAEG
jgi:hypothetical protein